MALFRNSFGRIINSRFFSLYPRLQLKEISEVKENDTLVINANYVDSDRVSNLFQPNKDKAECCPLCRTGLDLKHTDVLILSQFLRSDGCMMPRRVTKLCKNQQKRVSILVAMAQKAGLMSILTPPTSKKDPKKRKYWKKFNTYFLEETIDLKPKRRSIHARDHTSLF